MANSSNAEYLESLERMGMTGHPGGLTGTKAVLSHLDIRHGERVLDLGCGTGYTATLIAAKSAETVATDLRPGMLDMTRKRVIKEGVAGSVRLVAGDAQCLPFKDNTFDAAVVESVLVFCDVPHAVGELFRVLKPEGRLGCNEATFLMSVPHEKVERFSEHSGFKIAMMTAAGWIGAFEEAGFEDIASEVKPIDWLDVAVLTPVKMYGVGGYLSALAKSITDPEVRKVRWRRRNLAAHRMLRDLCSGIYTARKPSRPGNP